jgi:hypothetical protein
VVLFAPLERDGFPQHRDKSLPPACFGLRSECRKD